MFDITSNEKTKERKEKKIYIKKMKVPLYSFIHAIIVAVSLRDNHRRISLIRHPFSFFIHANQLVSDSDILNIVS